MTDEAERKHDPAGRADEHADALLNAFDEIDRKNRTKNAMVQAGQRHLRFHRDRHAGDRQLSDAARPFNGRHAGYARQRQFSRRRRAWHG
jgi:hypothetical protein